MEIGQSDHNLIFWTKKKPNKPMTQLTFKFTISV